MKRYKPYYIKWYVAIRKREEGILDLKAPFIMLDNPSDGWCADPFLFEFEEKQFIFAEKYDYKRQKGHIVYTEILDGYNCEWKQVISEDFHLSYPFIWKDNNGIHLIAETNESRSIYVYKCKEFPNKWVKDKLIYERNCFADTTLLFDFGDNNWIFTYGCEGLVKGKLFFAKVDKELNILNKMRIVTNNPIVARPGGNFIVEKNKTFRVCQDCKEDYGKRLSFCEIQSLNEDGYTEKMAFQRSFEDIVVNKRKNIIGMHTYNRNGKYEVIDLRVREISLMNLLYYLKRKFGHL